MYVCLVPIFIDLVSLTSASFSGVDVQEAEEDCQTEATTPTSFEPVSQSQMSTVELDEMVPEDGPPAQGVVTPVDEDTHPAEERSAPQEEVSPLNLQDNVALPKDENTDELKDDTDSSRQSVDELLADWQEDLEAFQQMEKDEL